MTIVCSAWGQEFEKSLVARALPSFFSHDTTALLKETKPKLKIFTSKNSTITVQQIRNYLPHVFFKSEIIHIVPFGSPIATLTHCHRLALQKAQIGENLFFIQADNIFSDNWGELISQIIRKGYKIIAPLGLRVSREDFLKNNKNLTFSSASLCRQAIEYIHSYCSNHDILSRRHINSGTFLLRKHGIINKGIVVKTASLHPIFLKVKNTEKLPKISLDDNFWENQINSFNEIYFTLNNNKNCVINLSSQNDPTLLAAAERQKIFKLKLFKEKLKSHVLCNAVSKKYCNKILNKNYYFGKRNLFWEALFNILIKPNEIIC